jgi:7-keto-8-aminopelargonate synthetase-like enzyme
MSDSISIINSFPPLLFASALSAYGLYLSKENITRLQQYEKQSEKAAEWSNTAAQKLHKTRTTQTSGTVTVCP